MAVDIDFKALNTQRELDALLVQCDASKLPFKESVFDLSVANFTLHEINPSSHQEVVLELFRVSKRIMMIEPTPGVGLYKRYTDIWKRAMHSIGRFEDIEETSHWQVFLQRCGIKLRKVEIIVRKKNLPNEEVERCIKCAIKIMREYGVVKEYINELNELIEDAKTTGFKHSDTSVLIGKCPL